MKRQREKHEWPSREDWPLDPWNKNVLALLAKFAADDVATLSIHAMSRMLERTEYMIFLSLDRLIGQGYLGKAPRVGNTKSYRILINDTENEPESRTTVGAKEKYSPLTTLGRVWRGTEAIIREQLSLRDRDLFPESRLYADLGADNLDVMEIVMSVEDEFEVPINEWPSDPTVSYFTRTVGLTLATDERLRRLERGHNARDIDSRPLRDRLAAARTLATAAEAVDFIEAVMPT